MRGTVSAATIGTKKKVFPDSYPLKATKVIAAKTTTSRRRPGNTRRPVCSAPRTQPIASPHASAFDGRSGSPTIVCETRAGLASTPAQ